MKTAKEMFNDFLHFIGNPSARIPAVKKEPVKETSLEDGKFTTSVKINFNNKLLTLQPLINEDSKIEEWQLLISNPPQVDYNAASHGEKPKPGHPIATPLAIRFHPDDVVSSIDIEKEIAESGKAFVKNQLKHHTRSCYITLGSEQNTESGCIQMKD